MRLGLLCTTALVSTITPGVPAGREADGVARPPSGPLSQMLSRGNLGPMMIDPGAFGAPLVCGDGEIYFLGELPLDDPRAG